MAFGVTPSTNNLPTRAAALFGALRGARAASPNAPLAALLQTAKATTLRARHPSAFAETDRIVALPVIRPFAPEELEAFNRQEVLAGAYANGYRLRDNQAGVLLAWDTWGGVYGSVGVGFGKTVSDITVAERAHRQGIERTLLLLPPSVYSQFWDDLKETRNLLPLTCAFHRLEAGNNPRDRQTLARTKRHGCYVMPYSLLRVVDTEALLETIAPGLIIMDEADELQNRRAAQTQRLWRYIATHKPKGVALTGTMTSKSLLDCWHVMTFCLGKNSPLPLTSDLAADWALAVDAQAAPSTAQKAPLEPLVTWARATFPEETFALDVPGFRKAFRLRFTTCPGVVSTGSKIIDTRLRIVNTPVAAPEQAPGWSDLLNLVYGVEFDMVTPNGDAIEHAIHKYKWLHELSAGFYYELTWPTAAEYSSRVHAGRRHTLTEAETILANAKKHHVARQAYSRELRAWLDAHAGPGLDTPMLVGKYIAQHPHWVPGVRVSEVLTDLWVAARALEFPGMPERDSAAVRVCPYKIAHAVAWATEHPRGSIVWYHHDEVGVWLTERLTAAGLNPLHCRAGKQQSVVIRQVGSAERLVVASIRGHGRGKNLQRFSHQLVVQFPRSAKHAEQLLGRVHRHGQKRDVVTVDTCLTTVAVPATDTRGLWTMDFDEKSFSAMLTDSVYIHQTTGAWQKPVYAEYDPKPRMYPPEWLREHGFRNQLLTQDQARIVVEKFAPLS